MDGANSECVSHLRAFLLAGPAGVNRLRKVWRSIRREFHLGDPSGWGASCEQAFAGDPLMAAGRSSDWDLDGLEVYERLE
jgi:hypothetical protein